MVFYTHLQIANFIVLYLRIIRIDKPAGVRVIVPALQVVQPGFIVIPVPTVAVRIFLPDRTGQTAANVQQLAPAVIGIGYHLVHVAVNKTYESFPVCNHQTDGYAEVLKIKGLTKVLGQTF